MRIAIIDDSADAITLLRRRLGETGIAYHVITYTMLDTDITQSLADFQPDLLITDLVLESDRKDGYSLIRDLQKHQALSKVPIVVVSKLINPSPSGQGVREECLRLPGVAGAFGKVAGPSLEELKNIIRNAKND